MNSPPMEFYQVGGNIPQEALCYVRRRADTELVAALSQGDFCYVLTARQMGKSSLMVRAAAQLRADGRAVAVIDLQALGQNATLGQWYGHMLREIAEQLDLEEEIEAFCRETAAMSPLQQWRAALREMVLRWSDRPVVLFIDEIDFVRSLPFKTDEFFAAIREFYNRRSAEPELRHLAFCLLGVATPSDLIRDSRVTPFNIGRRVELTDFAPEEAQALAQGLHSSGRMNQGAPKEGDGKRLLERVLYWTGGHPYLTQKLCRAAAQDSRVQHPADVDRLCREQFFSSQASREESNLQFVSAHLLQSEADLADLLGLYHQVLQGRRISDNEADSRVSLLKLSGIVRSLHGRLYPRNRIYAHVFSSSWVRNHLPDADLRRQRTAFFRGMLRTAGVLGGFLAITCTLAVIAFQQAQVAKHASANERAQRRRTERLLYADDMNIAQQAWNGGISARTVELLQAHLPGKDETDLRGFEWGMLWHLCHREWQTLTGHRQMVYAVAFSPDGRYVASACFDGRVKVWEAATGKERITLEAHRPWVYAVAFSPDGRLLATAGRDGLVCFWDTQDFQKVHTLLHPANLVTRMAYSPDGSLLATASGEENKDFVVRLWTTRGWREQATLKGHRGEVLGMAFSPDNRHLLTTCADSTARLWDVVAGREVRRRTARLVYGQAFAPDGKTLAVGWDSNKNNRIEIWDAATLQTRRSFIGHTGVVHCLAYSRDGKTLASASWDYTARLWDVASGSTLSVIRGHTQKVNAVAFSPDGKLLATGSNDRTVKLWRLPFEPEVSDLPAIFGRFVFLPDGKHMLTTDKSGVAAYRRLDTLQTHSLFPLGRANDVTLAISADARLAAMVRNDLAIYIWDVPLRRERAALRGHSKSLRNLSFSPDGALLASASDDGTIRLWDTVSGKERCVLRVEGHTDAVYCVAFSPDGKTLASGGDDNTARLWDVATGREIGVMHGRGMYDSHEHSVNEVVFSPDGHLLATASWDTTVKVWDVASRQELGVLRGHLDSVGCLAFSPDGKTLASGSYDNTVKLWNIATLREVATLRDGQSGVTAVRFSSDGALLATVNTEGRLFLRRSVFPP